MALLSCPECSQKISDQAHACPHCGYPIKKTSQSKNKLTQDLEDIKTAGAWLAFFISLPTLAIPTIISTLLNNPGEFNQEAAKVIWDTFLLTAPLTCAVAIIGLWMPMIIKKREKQKVAGKTPNDHFYYLLMGSGCIFSLWIATEISQLFLTIKGVDVIAISYNTHASGYAKIFLIIWNVFAQYFQIYGVYNFFSSLAVGVFLAWIWNSKILGYFKN